MLLAAPFLGAARERRASERAQRSAAI